MSMARAFYQRPSGTMSVPNHGTKDINPDSALALVAWLALNLLNISVAATNHTVVLLRLPRLHGYFGNPCPAGYKVCNLYTCCCIWARKDKPFFGLGLRANRSVGLAVGAAVHHSSLNLCSCQLYSSTDDEADESPISQSIFAIYTLHVSGRLTPRSGVHRCARTLLLISSCGSFRNSSGVMYCLSSCTNLG